MNVHWAHWHQHILAAAWMISGLSNDAETNVGCVIVNRDGTPLALGHNGLPWGVQERPERLRRPTKYPWMVHAEVNAIAHAARQGICIEGAVAFVTHHPCSRCAGALVNAGIVAVIHDRGTTAMPAEEFEIAAEIFKERGVLLTAASRLQNCPD